jgi:ATP-dependent DNA helicase RecG
VANDPLAPLLAPLTDLPGIAEKLARLLARAIGGTRVIDLLLHLPEHHIDRRAHPSLADLRPGGVATVIAELVRLERPETARQPWRLTLGDGSGFADLVFFRPHARITGLAPGTRLAISGAVTLSAGRPAFVHPEHLHPAARAALIPAIEPVWPLTTGLAAWQIRKAMTAALARLPAFSEWIDPELRRRRGWPEFAAALRAWQAPETPPDPLARQRLAYDELFADQLRLALLRARRRARPGRALTGDGHLRARALAAFGHELTAGQRAALAEIDADLAAPRPMRRLLQGDVGSGKTILALLAMLRAVEAGAQAALMAPTEILARQHFRTLAALAPVPVAILTGGMSASARRETLAMIAGGAAPLAVGTHALFQREVAFRDLALAVIDEQHRFGVGQRSEFGAKGRQPDVLMMTATPIPRTLLLTQWGEMEVSRLAGKPAGRQPVKTTLHAAIQLPAVIAALARALASGARIYWICPLVAETEASDLAAAEERFTRLAERFPGQVALAHGRQKPAEREAALAAFAGGEKPLLVATTVVEVGVDVPSATVMVVEHAERFGLAQLHQLRGRIGRGAAPSFCLLMHGDGGEAAETRLAMLRDTEDGFAIANADFRLRGGGDALGTRQSGEPGFRLAALPRDEALLRIAKSDAAVLLARDPDLAGERGRAARLALRLFGARGRGESG